MPKTASKFRKKDYNIKIAIDFSLMRPQDALDFAVSLLKFLKTRMSKIYGVETVKLRSTEPNKIKVLSENGQDLEEIDLLLKSY